ncbi:MAG: sigma-70 family RNA polymerase sigma factor [Terrimesophilobacter sp.]
MRPFERIVEEHGARVLRVCRAVVGPIDADDAWSETFLSALTAYPTLTPDSDVQAWLVTIAHRKAIDVLRARARRAIPVGEVPERAGTLGIPDDTAREVWSVVAALPERQRLAVAYHYFGGLPHAATAHLIGGSVESVRRAASDGIAALRKFYVTTERSETS